jgi:hypothetical protein
MKATSKADRRPAEIGDDPEVEKPVEPVQRQLDGLARAASKALCGDAAAIVQLVELLQGLSPEARDMLQSRADARKATMPTLENMGGNDGVNLEVLRGLCHPPGDLHDQGLDFSDPFSVMEQQQPVDLPPEFLNFAAEQFQRLADKLAQREEQRRREIEFERNLDALMIQRLDDDGAPAFAPSAAPATGGDAAVEPRRLRRRRPARGREITADPAGDIRQSLLRLLEELAVKAGKGPEDAHQTLMNIFCGLGEAEDAKYAELREQRQQARWRAYVEENPPYTRESAAPFVRTKALTQAGMAEEQAIELAKTTSWEAMSHVEQRAVELLSGAKTRAAKPYVERAATALARAVRKEWRAEPTQKKKRPRGRPPGKHRGAVVPTRPEEQITIPISFSEVVSIVLPEIEDLIGGKVSPSLRDRHGDDPMASSSALEAVVLAVQLGKLQGMVAPSELETIRREAARVHREKR